MNFHTSALIRFALLTIFSVLSLPHAVAQTSPAKVFSLQGSATIQRGGTAIPAAVAMQLEPGDEVRVGEPGRVALELADGSYVRLPGGARLTFPAGERQMGLVQGAMHFFSHSEKHPTVVTDHVTAAIRGTEFTLLTEKDSTTVRMISGALEGTSVGGTATLGGGQGARFTKSGKAPEIFTLLASDTSVQWSLFVPALGTADDLTLLARGGKPEADAVSLIERGETAKALAALPPSGTACSEASILRGRLLIAHGNVEGGSSELERCVKSSAPSPLKPLAASSLALVSLMGGNPQQADALSTEALSGAQPTAATRLTRSFVLQERGDLDGALAALGEASSTESSDVQARRAELLFMFGRVPEARAALEALDDRSWYADTVLGFARMADRSFDEAHEAFARAAEREPGAGLPQIGLGLIAVNRGNLDEGRAHFERATVLEPSRSLYRSYLAKSYFEADTYSPAEPEYERAMTLDPNDPTPHLYRSFMRLAQNRPVEALRDIEESQRLADARSVYRSSFLLDEDAAVQSASLSRTYRDLGFLERGRIEAISAIMSDYRNASAHRLLAESQENVFSADASLSERRIADLFAPLSINVVDSIGSSVSLNEYSALFERDGWRTGISSGYASLDDITSLGVVTARKSGNIVTGLSASGVALQGLDSEPYSSQGNVGVSLQAQPTWGDRLLFEARGFFGEDHQGNEDTHFDNGNASAAYLHRFSPDVSAIVQTYFERNREQLVQPELEGDLLFNSLFDGTEESALVGALYDSNTDRYETLWVNEAQLIARTGPVNSLLTLRTSRNNADNYDEKILLAEENEVLNGLGVTYNSLSPVNLQSDLVSYLSTVSLSRSLSLNLGTSYELVEWEARTEAPYDGNTQSRSRLNPRVGLVYKPSSAAMARIAYTETLGKGLQNDLVSLDPTLVGGITQRYNDLPGTFSQNLGMGLDFHPLKDTYVGTEWVRRWLDESGVDAVYQVDVDFDNATATRGVAQNDPDYLSIQQDFVNAYLYQVVTKQLVLGSDYRYIIQGLDVDDREVVRDHRARAFSRYFFANGLFLQSSATFRYQGRLNGAATDLGSSSSGWLFGAGVGYRLPTRHGFVIAEVDNIFGQDFAVDDTTFFNEIIDNDPMVRLAANFNF